MATLAVIKFFQDGICLELDFKAAEQRRYSLELLGYQCAIVRAASVEYHIY
jgi:hypothetical protein